MATWTISSTFNVQVGTVTATDITVSYLAGKDGADFTNDGTVDIYANTVRLNTSPSAAPGLQGEFSWNSDEETADLNLNGAVLQLGQEIHYHVRNNSGAEIADGKAVMATGTIGASGRITIGLMDGSSIANAKYFLGITTETIANGTDGKVTSLGKVRGIDTSAFTEGDVLWVDNDNVGELTSTMPTTKSKLPIAFVVTDHASNGVLAVRATDGTYFGEAHDVDLSSVTDEDYIYYDNASSVWKNKQLAITLAKLDASLKTRVTANVVTSYAINHNNGIVFELTMTGATTFTDSNLPTGTDTKDFLVILDGNYVPTFPTYWEATPNSEAYDGTVRNWIVVSVINGTGSSEDVVYEITNLST